MGYLPLDQYGVIGDMETVALVGLNGSVDWWCYPHFDSPSVFGAILDDSVGGRFQITVLQKGGTRKQLYFPDTNILVTRFLNDYGVAELTDFMPVASSGTVDHQRRLIRRLTVIRGRMHFRLECRPAFDYARAPHRTEVLPHGAIFRADHLSLMLRTEISLKQDGDAVVAGFVLHEGQSASFTLGEQAADRREPPRLNEDAIEQDFHDTVRYWRQWIGQSRYRGRWREMVQRSALVLKLLTFHHTGAIVAAPTCSLPETVGGERNWDYRYTWLRDASFTLYALMRIGFTTEAERFMDWLQRRIHEMNPDGSLQTVYSLKGRHDLSEERLDHLEGYRGSRPVRVGNRAYAQLQLDIYGELMDAVYLYNKYGKPISHALWGQLRRLLNWVVQHWQEPDEGIWEVRQGRRHFVYSKLMCWVALDRGLRLAEKRSLPADRDLWLKTRDEIYDDIMAKGWSESRQAFTGSYGSESLDAANLVMPLVFFASPTDPRMLATIQATLSELTSGSLVYRYNVKTAPDGLKGMEGTFSMCSFWLVEALTRAGRIDEARLMFEKMLGYANHLGLFSEQIGPSGETLGNYPQALTHLALISAAYNLDRALSVSAQAEGTG